MPSPATHKERHHALNRSLTHLTIGVARDMERRRRRSNELGLREVEEQIQLPISGLAVQGITWAKARVGFENTFYEAPSQRDSNFDRPHFTYGVSIDPVDDKEPPIPVVVSCMFEFTTDDRGATTGGWLHIGVHSPTPDTRRFQGVLNLRFQGFGASSSTGVGE